MATLTGSQGRPFNASVLASASYVLPGLTGAVARRQDARDKERVSVKDFGAVGDGVTPDQAAFKAALLSEAHDIYVPPGTYVFSQAIWFACKGKRLHGVPGRSILLQTGNFNSALDYFFVPGPQAPVAFDATSPGAEKHDRIAVSGALVAGTRQVLLTGTPPANCQAGMTVWVRDSVEYARGGWAQPDSAQLVRIERVSGNTLYLETGLLNSMPGAIVSPANSGNSSFLTSLFGETVPWGLVEDTTFEDLTFEGGRALMNYTGMYRCLFRNIVHNNPIYGPLFNAATESRVEGLRSTFGMWACEIKQSCTDLVINDLALTYRPVVRHSITWDNNAGSIYPFDIGERSVNVSFNRLKLYIGAEWTAAQRVIDLGDCRNIDIAGGDIMLSDGGTNAVYGCRAGNDSGSTFRIGSFRFANRVHMATVRSQLSLIQGTANQPVVGVTMDNEWSGLRTSGGAGHQITAFATDVDTSRERPHSTAVFDAESAGMVVANGEVRAAVTYAEAAISAGRAVKQGSAEYGVLQATGGTAPITGISLNAAAGGAAVRIARQGSRLKAVPGSPWIAVGDPLSSDTGGKLRPAVVGEWVGALAQVTASSGDVSAVTARRVIVVSPYILRNIYTGYATGITAQADATKANATVLTKEWNEVSTVAGANDSILLPAAVTGAVVHVRNSGANALDIFGAGTDTINALATATALAIAVNDTVHFTCFVTGNWKTS